MQLMRRLADQGRTIVLITHATKNVMLADKVVFLARGGYLSWFGPPDEALAYFDKQRSERDRRARDIEFDEIYNILDDSSKGSAPDWADRYQKHEAYQKYVVQPLQEKAPVPIAAPVSATTVATSAAPKRKRQVGGMRQFGILSSRNIKILTRDRFGLILMLAAPPLVSLLDVVLSLALGSAPFDFVDGKLPDVMITLFLLSVYGVMVGGLSQMREIVKEQEVYKRERLVNLRLFPYIMSKVWIAAILAVYAGTIYTVVHFLAFDMPEGSFLYIYISLTLATMAGMMLGLFASAIAPNANSAPLIVVLLMLPQIVLGGALVPLPQAITSPISTRWAFQAFMAATGPGSDVAADACWVVLTEDEQKALTLEQKNEQCNCMGVNALNEDSCGHPGLGVFYDPIIDTPQPQSLDEQPPEKPVEPIEPEIPPQPEEPEDQSDLVAQGEYREAIQAWQEEATQIQDSYRAEVEVYRAELQVFEAEVGAYQDRFATRERERVEWQIAQEASILPAESIIRQFYGGFGWTFVDQNNPDVYPSTIYRTWVAQAIIIAVLLGLILVAQKRKDAVS